MPERKDCFTWAVCYFDKLIDYFITLSGKFQCFLQRNFSIRLSLCMSNTTPCMQNNQMVGQSSWLLPGVIFQWLLHLKHVALQLTIWHCDQEWLREIIESKVARELELTNQFLAWKSIFASLTIRCWSFIQMIG